jgi:hypothetical protein
MKPAPPNGSRAARRPCSVAASLLDFPPDVRTESQRQERSGRQHAIGIAAPSYLRFIRLARACGPQIGFMGMRFPSRASELRRGALYARRSIQCPAESASRPVSLSCHWCKALNAGAWSGVRRSTEVGEDWMSRSPLDERPAAQDTGRLQYHKPGAHRGRHGFAKAAPQNRAGQPAAGEDKDVALDRTGCRRSGTTVGANTVPTGMSLRLWHDCWPAWQPWWS